MEVNKISKKDPSKYIKITTNLFNEVAFSTDKLIEKKLKIPSARRY